MSFEYSQELMKDYEKLLEKLIEDMMLLFTLVKIRFIYCGKIDLKESQVPEILNLLIVVDEHNIQTLVQCIQEYLIKYKYDFLQQNSIEVFEITHDYEAFTDLWNYCLGKICEKSDELFKSDKFINLKESLLELLLNRDDLLTDEIVKWDSLIKWSFAQHPNIQKDVKKWNKEEIITMGKTLHRFIPLIRFYHITSADFFLKLYPFKVFLPEVMIDKLVAFHMIPAKKSIYDFIIINVKHFALFSNWIEMKNDSYYNESNYPYDFKLLYRASRDGKTTVAFRSKCDNKGATIVIMKIPNSEQILGGYNPLERDSSDIWKFTRESFIFSFMNRDDFNSSKVGYINDPFHAIHCLQDCKPTFGSGHNLFQDNDSSWKNIPKGYVIGNYDDFNVEDYEVFQVVKK
ncbi:hypothetical protein RclHR1_07410012 [Rhizophagus clarus]|uniref:BTB/POZ domain-containing protein n=1 Tax=Rhizophagus clarus TaxID=94130 RepID=A0A2Z6RWQ3_9GLOM|nr:hypothetical protein RclHR1_07410012 [Rhizophagus clarus]GES85040.1 BTB/POZ domain-containing protein [Rhizophagus clarus]